MIDQNTQLRLLDMEGENGSLPPVVRFSFFFFLILVITDLSWWMKQLDFGLSPSEQRELFLAYQQQRRTAVSQTLPRLTFVTCDVVIFISNESFANANYQNRLRQLVFESTEHVDSAYSPALILVHNKCGLDEQFDVDLSTNLFFSNDENAPLRQLYSDVKCICIPHTEQSKRFRSHGQEFIFDGREIFSDQMRKLVVRPLSQFFLFLIPSLSLFL